MNIPGIKAAATFHGVFDSVAVDGTTVDEIDNAEDRPSCLVCNGSDDPFVNEKDLSNCKQIFESNGWEWKLLEYEGTCHGFTNPAQDLNPSEAFAFNKDSAESSWLEAMVLLKEKLS